MERKYTFGPVPSRRLGFSLGIDIIPIKSCTYNCTYCQLFQTSNHINTRQSFMDKDAILSEIRHVIENTADIDYLTFSGSGEPTLNKDLAWLIEHIKAFTDIPIAVITNSSLLWDADVRNALSKADLVVPSLDSVTEDIWKKLNRPAKGLLLKKVLDGLTVFCSEHKGSIWLEVMIVEGTNDSDDEITKIADFANSLAVDKVQLNTVVRPPNETFAKPLTQERLEEIATYFHANTEIIAPFTKKAKSSGLDNVAEKILVTLSRRPCRPSELADSLGLNVNEIVKEIKDLEDQDKIVRETDGFYSVH